MSIDWEVGDFIRIFAAIKQNYLITLLKTPFIHEETF